MTEPKKTGKRVLLRNLESFYRFNLQPPQVNCLEIEVASESGQVPHSKAMIELLHENSPHHFSQLLTICINGKVAFTNREAWKGQRCAHNFNRSCLV